MLLCERVNSDKRMCIFIRKEEEEPSVVSATEGKERKPKATLELLTQQGGFHGLLTSATCEVSFCSGSPAPLLEARPRTTICEPRMDR